MRTRPIRTIVAGLVLLAFIATYLAMEWAGREPDTLILLTAAAIAIGAGYYLWGDAMGQGVDAAQDLQGGEENGDG